MRRDRGITFSGLALLGGVLAAAYWLERRRPLRHARESKLHRTSRNLAVAAAGAIAIRAVEQPIVERVAEVAERRGWGLLRQLGLPRPVVDGLGLLLLDYGLYRWHVLTHRVPFLWRFHLPHHADLDMDASTALRIHFGDIVLSVPVRAAQVAALGVSPGAYRLWQRLTLAEILFHHSNIELPRGVERWLSRVIVTPRMHGIHHSVVREEQNSNWSSGLTLWDWLHGTLRLDVPQDTVDIGVPAYRDPADVTLPAVVAMPFGDQRPTWELPGGGRPVRIGPPGHGELEPEAIS